MPTILEIKKGSGVAGQYELTATVDADGEVSHVTFIGSVYGGPIVMRLPSGIETFVHANVTSACGGKLSPDWVRAFFAQEA